MIFGELDITITNQVAPEFKNIAPVGWHVPTTEELTVLKDYYGGWEFAGGHLKEAGLVWWNDPNEGADNSSGFSAKGVGQRFSDGTFETRKGSVFFHASDTPVDNVDYGLTIDYISAYAGVFNNLATVMKKMGGAIRCVKNYTIKSIGETGTVTDIDGNVYPTKVMLDGNEWMTSDLIVSKFNDGTPIPVVTDNTAWAALTTAGMCWYDNTPE